MPYWIITFFLGVCSLLVCRELPGLYWLLTLMPMFLGWILTKQKTKKLFLQILIFVLGFCWALIYVHWVSIWSLPRNLEGKNIEITGYITAPPIAKSHRISFEFKTESIAKEKRKIKLKLGWYGKYPNIKAGDKWRLVVRLKRPHGTLNPGGFDFEKFLFVHHIRATGYVVKSESNRFLSVKFYHYPFARLRQFLIGKIDQVLPGDKLSSIITAFVTGSKDEITKSQWQVMRDTGTSYLVAISGLHIGLVASVIFVLFGFLWRLSSRLVLIIPARFAGIIAGLFIAFIYGVISGFSVPAQRALVMLTVFCLMVLLRRHIKPWNALLWSLFIVLIINPLSVLTIGFWLSFLAVFAIIYVNAGRLKQKRSYLNRFWRIQLTVTLTLLPFTLLFFQQFSLIAFVANLIAMPAVCFLVIPLSLLGVLFLLVFESIGVWVLWCSVKLMQFIWWWLEFLMGFSNYNWHHPIYNWWILLAASVGVLILLAPRGFPAKIIGILWFLPLFFYSPSKPINNEFWVTLLDVGQGLSAVIQTKNHVLLYDTGPGFFESNAGERVVVPYLRLAGVQIIDAMVISHGDSDHIGGARSILNVFPVNNIFTSVPEKFESKVVQSCFVGQHWQWDGVQFQMLSPPKHSSLIGNDASCVLKISNGKNSILLPGDVEYVAEKILVENHGVDLKSSVLVAPHHGSSTSSTDDFVEMVQPQYVVFPVGYRNRFRFPHKRVTAKYLKNGAILLNTSKEGAITFKFGDKSDILSVSRYRETYKRFWHDPKK